MLVKELFFFLFIFVPLVGFSQNIGAREIEPSNLTNWNESENQSYQGIYHFGEGDGSVLVLIVDGKEIIAQIRESGYWSEGGYAIEEGKAKESEVKIKRPYQTLTNVQITHGYFNSDQFEGRFVKYQDGIRSIKGLQINNPWNEWIGEGRYEVGIKVSRIENPQYFPGKYPEGSTRILSAEELNNYDVATLGIIRNEIFARYGYRFKRKEAMYKYFEEQFWYYSRYKDVSDYLTRIELINIALIKSVERKKRKQ